VGGFEREMLLEYLEKYGYSTESKRKIAKDLGMGLSTLYRKLQVIGVTGYRHDDCTGDNQYQEEHAHQV
jgi:DNA-binding NtrC family response regulator